MAEKWKAGTEIQDKINEMVGNHHPHLADICYDIVVIFKEKASRKGGYPIMGKTSKAPAILSVLGERQYQFVIEIGHDVWQKLTEAQQTALLDHLLSFIQGEEDEATAEMKYSLSEPDIYYFTEEVARHGYWRPDLSDKPSEESEEGVDPLDDLLDA